MPAGTHPTDQFLYRMRLRRLLLILLCFVSVSVFPQGKKADTEALGRAPGYFQSQKYHEALLIFQRLDQSYKLNARYKAYIGLCYYYDWDYKKATEYFDTFLPKLSMLAAEERALYYYADGESHFQLGHYDQAILLFQSALTLCHDRDKGDSWFRIGFCYYFLQQPALAQGLLPRSRILLRHVSQLSRPASETPADGTHDARLAARDRPQAPAKDFLPTPACVAYRLSQDRGRHIIYHFYHQASSSTNRTTTSRRRTKTATGRTTTGGKPSTERAAKGGKATTSRKSCNRKSLNKKKKATTGRKATTGGKASTEGTKGNRLSLPS